MLLSYGKHSYRTDLVSVERSAKEEKFKHSAHLSHFVQPDLSKKAAPSRVTAGGQRLPVSGAELPNVGQQISI